eukprot:s4765_g3.t1
MVSIPHPIQASAPWDFPKMTSFTQLEMMSQSLFMIQLPPHSYLYSMASIRTAIAIRILMMMMTAIAIGIESGATALTDSPTLPGHEGRREECSCSRTCQFSGVKRLNPMRPLEVALARLRSSLEAMSADTRRRAIEGLSKELRNELVSFMEAQGRRGTLGSRSMMQVPARSVSEGNIWTIRTSSRQYHRARCQIGGVLVRSGSVQRREEALSLLSRLRQTMSSATGDLEQRLVAAAEAFQGSASFVVTLDARRWLGRALESPTFRSLHETLRWRQLHQQ